MPTLTTTASAVLYRARVVTASAVLQRLGVVQTTVASAVLRRTAVLTVTSSALLARLLTTRADAVLETVAVPDAVSVSVYDVPPIIITGGVGAILYKGSNEQLQWLEIPADWADQSYLLTITGGLPAWTLTNAESGVFTGWGYSWGTSWGE